MIIEIPDDVRKKIKLEGSETLIGLSSKKTDFEKGENYVGNLVIAELAMQEKKFPFPFFAQVIECQLFGNTNSEAGSNVNFWVKFKPIPRVGN